MLLEEQFQLKTYGKLSLFEQATMTAEDRSWWMHRLEEERAREKEAQDHANSGLPRHGMPSMPT